MPDEPPIIVKSPSTDLARVPVETTREAPALSGGRADSPLFAVVATGPLDPAQRRRAAALAGVGEAALGGERPVLDSAGSAGEAQAAAAAYRAAGLPAEVRDTGGSRARLWALGLSVPMGVAAGLLVAGALPLAALSALLLLGVAAWIGARRRRAERSAAGAAALERERAADRRAPAAALIARVHALRRRVATADLAERIEADLLEGLGPILEAARALEALDEDRRERLGRAVAELEDAVRGLGTPAPGTQDLDALSERIRLSGAALAELRGAGERGGR